MRVTKHTDYALRVLIYLATSSEERVSTSQIADAHRISHAHLQKVVRALGEAGFIELHRGAQGGIELAQDSSEISIGEVVRLLEGHDALVECFQPLSSQCVISTACRLKGALARAQEAFFGELDPITLASLVRGRQRTELRKLTGQGEA